MKRFLWITLCLCVTLTTLAQKQQGLVRTIERPGQKSVGINGVTIKINEYPNAIVSGKGGKFSFTLQGKKQGDRCLVTRVEKKGYTLIDKMPSFAYSFSTPAEIVMVSNKQLQQDEKKIRDKAKKEAEVNYHKRIAELEGQLQEKTISEESYREQLQQVFDGYENFLKMIDEMARRYAMTDYKGISELNRQIQECIENAELECADSLINSKGNIHQRNQELLNKKETVQRLAELHNQAQEDYETSLNDLSQDYYNKHLICAAKYQNDSAAYWLEQRAALDDSTNVEWLRDAGDFIIEYLAHYSLAMKYYQKGLYQARIQFGEQSEWVATFYNNIGVTYSDLEDSTRALEYLSKALSLDSCSSEIAFNNLATLYDDIGEYQKALDYHLKSLSLREHLYGKDHPITATSYNNIGLSYQNLGDYPNALECFKKCIQIREKEYGQYHSETAMPYNNIGLLYIEMGKFSEAIIYLQKALSIRETIFGLSHPLTANTTMNIGAAYKNLKDYTKAFEYYSKAITCLEKAYNLENNYVLAACYNNISAIYLVQENYEKALEYQSKVLESFEKKYGSDNPKTATACNNVGYTYRSMGDYDNALLYFFKALDIRKKKLDKDHPSIAKSLTNIGGVYKSIEQYEKAYEYLSEALRIFEKALGADHQNTIMVKESLDFVKQHL